MKEIKQPCISNVTLFCFLAFFKNKFTSTCIRVMLILIFFSGTPVFSQKFSLQPGIGLGSSLAKSKNGGSNGRIMINLSSYYNLNKRISLGLESAIAGSFINSVGGNSDRDEFDPATNTISKDVSNMKSTTVLAKVKYYFTSKEKGMRPFAEFGLGASTYYENVFNIPGFADKKIEQTRLVYQPEIGFSLGHFHVSARYLAGGRTPQFTGVDDSGTNVKYESIRISPLYIHASWRFDL